jgi:hypothetical protein
MNHPRISELLPWYVNGSLELGDRQAAALEAASCDDCARDVETLTQIQAAVLEIDARAPEPSEAGFARALASVEAEEQKRRLGHPWFGWWWSLRPFARAATVSVPVLVAIVAIGIIVPKGHAPAGSGENAISATPISLDALTQRNVAFAPRSAAAGAQALQSSAAKAATAPQPSLAQTAQIARTGSVSLLVSNVESAIAAIGAVARGESGEVLNLTDTTPAGAGERHTAQIEIGVPADRFDSAVVALVRLGGLRSRSVGAENVATQIVDTQARLRNLRRAEADYLKIMDRAGRISDVLDVEDQLVTTRQQIEEYESESAALSHRVAYSTIAIDLEDETAPPTASVTIATQLLDSWHAAVQSVRAFTATLFGGLLWIVAYGPYLIAIAAIVGLIAVRLRRA